MTLRSASAAAVATASLLALVSPAAAQSTVALPPAPAISSAPPLYVSPLASRPYESALTARFVANAMPNLDFLDRSSRLALDRSPSASIRNFAHREATEQTLSANTLTAWADTNAPLVTGRSAYVPVPDAGPLTPVVGLATLPLDVAADTGAALTGGTIAPAVTPAPLRSQTKDLDRLRTLGGREFDTLYISSQADALQQLSTLYRDYIHDGDDPGLRALARRELPRIQRRFDQVNSL